MRPPAHKSLKHLTPAYRTTLTTLKSTLQTTNITTNPSLQEPGNTPLATVQIKSLRKTSVLYATRKDAGQPNTLRKSRISQERDLRAKSTNTLQTMKETRAKKLKKPLKLWLLTLIPKTLARIIKTTL